MITCSLPVVVSPGDALLGAHVEALNTVEARGIELLPDLVSGTPPLLY